MEWTETNMPLRFREIPVGLDRTEEPRVESVDRSGGRRDVGGRWTDTRKVLLLLLGGWKSFGRMKQRHHLL